MAIKIRILTDSRAKSGFVTGHAAGKLFQAKVYDEPSDYGINNGRVSKLAVSVNAENFAVSCFNYDRGLDHDDTVALGMPAGLVDAIVEHLDALPVVA